MQVLDDDAFRAFVERLEATFAEHAAELDEINVFPVADADTGSNVLGTVRSVREALEAEDDSVAEIVPRAALRGAQGNAGTILSQVLGSLAEMAADGPMDAGAVAEALEEARDRAYAAVSDPVEGTMLTAIATAAAAADRCRDDALETQLEVALKETGQAVQATPELLPELAEADVVDAGARAFELTMHSLYAIATDYEVDIRPSRPENRQLDSEDSRPGQADGGGRYEVQYVLEGATDKASALRNALAELGESVEVAESGGLLRVHIHTDDIGSAVEVALEFGRPAEIEVADLRDQVEQTE